MFVHCAAKSTLVPFAVNVICIIVQNVSIRTPVETRLIVEQSCMFSCDELNSDGRNCGEESDILL